MKNIHAHRLKHIQRNLWILIFLLVGCGKPAQSVQTTTAPATQTTAPTETDVPNTETPTSISFTLTPPDPTADPTIFGAIGTDEIQAYVLESVANAIFSKTMDGFIADGRIQEYQVISITVFPGSNGLLSEIIFNVKTTDAGWIAEGGTPADDNWLNGKCYRFDFFTTEKEYQLNNRRLCG